MEKVTIEQMAENPSLAIIDPDNFSSNLVQGCIIARHMAYNIRVLTDVDNVDNQQVRDLIVFTEWLTGLINDAQDVLDAVDEVIAKNTSDSQLNSD